MPLYKVTATATLQSHSHCHSTKSQPLPLYKVRATINLQGQSRCHSTRSHPLSLYKVTIPTFNNKVKSFNALYIFFFLNHLHSECNLFCFVTQFTHSIKLTIIILSHSSDGSLPFYILRLTFQATVTTIITSALMTICCLRLVVKYCYMLLFKHHDL